MATVNKMMTRALKLYNYLDEKDVFLGYYSQLFAKRLITNSSFSRTLEGIPPLASHILLLGFPVQHQPVSAL